jgi:hypothetical protein
MQYIAFDSHKRYTLASVEELESGKIFESRIEHTKGSIVDFLNRCDPGSQVAIETLGNWYWIVDEMEAAGMIPKLVHARKAKMMLAMVNKTDKLDGVPRRPPFLWMKVPRWQLPVQPSSEECM